MAGIPAITAVKIELGASRSHRNFRPPRSWPPHAIAHRL